MTAYFHPGRKVLFQHVPCTGGVEFFTVLWQLCGPYQAAIYPKGGGREWKPVEEALGPQSPFNFVSAHADPLGPIAPYIDVVTFYRDPVERALSQHFFSRRMEREKGLPERDIPPEKDWPPLGVAGPNHYLRWACRLAGVPLDGTAEVDARALAIAKAVVEQGYLWIGITEMFQPSLQLLAKKLNWPELPPSMSPAHVKSGRPKTADLPEQMVAWARHVMFFDQMLYEKALARTQRKISAMQA